MIAQLRGVVVDNDIEGTIVLDVSGVGYEITVSASCHRWLHLGTEATVMIRSITRDDGTVLYGFSNATERGSFDKLRTVQGVGPSLALGILSRLGEDGVRRAVRMGDAKLFRSVPGVGQRLSDRLVLELQRFYDQEEIAEQDSSELVGAHSQHSDIEEALLSLGFSSQEVSGALANLPNDIDPAHGVRQALRSLRR